MDNGKIKVRSSRHDKQNLAEVYTHGQGFLLELENQMNLAYDVCIEVEQPDDTDGEGHSAYDEALTDTDMSDVSELNSTIVENAYSKQPAASANLPSDDRHLTNPDGINQQSAFSTTISPSFKIP